MPTPLKPIPKSLPSSVKVPQTDDYVKESQASMTRLLNVWSSLAEKYSKPLEEDDIVDVLTGEVVKDRGVISGWNRSQQSFFTGKYRSRKCGETRGEEGETQEQVKGETAEGTNEELIGGGDDEFDELDSFATQVGPDLLHTKEAQDVSEHCSDVDNTDFLNFRDDEEDLNEFMQAEKRRKQLYGDDDSSDSDLELLQSELRQFRCRSTFVYPVESENEASCPPPSSSPLLSSSPLRTSSPTIPPSSPSVGPSSSSARVSSSPVQSVFSFKSPSYSSGRASFSSTRTSRRRTSSLSKVPPSHTSTSSSSFQALCKLSSPRVSPWPPSSPATPMFPSFRAASSVRLSSPDMVTSSSAASSSSVRLSTPSLPPSSSSIRWSSPSSSIQSFLPRLPFSPPVRSPSCFTPFDSDSEDELLGVWAQPEGETSTKSLKLKQPNAIQGIPSKTPGLKLKRIKRKRVVTSSDEETAPSLSVISSSMRAKSLSPKKRVVDKGVLYSAYDDTCKKDEGTMRNLRTPKHVVPNR